MIAKDEPGRTSEPADEPGRPRFRLLFLLPVLAFVALCALFLARLYAGDPSRLPSALIGRSVPAFSLPRLEGLSAANGTPLPGIGSTDLSSGRVTVLNVWASWCAPCRDEHPVLLGLARDPAIRLVGIAYKDKPENARRFLQGLGNPFAAVGLDESGGAGIEFGVYGVPETFVVGPDGTIRYKHVGPLTEESLPGFLLQVRAATRKP